MEKKYHIERNTVQETLVIPLYGRKLAMDMYPDLFSDRECQKLCDKLDYEYKGKNGIKDRIGAVMGATRQYDLACECRDYLKKHPKAAVVNLGCGLDTTFRQVDNGKAKSYCIDMPDVIEIRKKLLPEAEREIYIACDLKNSQWFEQIDFQREDGIVFFASGVFYYFHKNDVRQLVCKMAENFPGGRLAFDATNEKGIKSMKKTWLDSADIDVATYFYLENAEREIRTWSDRISSVKKRGYMTGYRGLDKRYGLIENMIFKRIDKNNSCQMIEVEFGK